MPCLDHMSSLLAGNAYLRLFSVFIIPEILFISSLVFRCALTYTTLHIEAFCFKTAFAKRHTGGKCMNHDPLLYHGSIFGGLDTILAHSKSHVDGSKVAYFTTERIYALVCCRSRAENHVTMGLRKDGKQHYFETFPDQLKVLYEGKEGFIYTPVSTGTLQNTRDHSWESHVDVPVVLQEHVSDVYAEILKEKDAGNVIVHHYEDIDPIEQKEYANHIRDTLNDVSDAGYREFLYRHFSTLWD